MEGWGVLDANDVIPMADAWPTLRDALASGNHAIEDRLARSRADRIALSSVSLLPPVTRPGKIFCVGVNYGRHAAEAGRELPSQPSVFVRHIQSFVGHGGHTIRPWLSDRYDFEAELAVVIGRGGRHIQETEAMDHVAGYTCAAENSVRDFQKHSTQATAGKNFDASGALGPWITLAGGAPSLSDMRVIGRLNGTEMQNGAVADLVFPVPYLIAYLSSFATLEPGDLILTGTPEGVGSARKPPVWMKEGDVFEVEIAGVGLLSNTVSDEARPAGQAASTRRDA
ncbi:fumarylacetoacetate hydrolase family protein [Bordetella sp. BOR01]|nr:fumarylacetoacetate hydrolase family protein [Bordetella sp. BOR01]MBV7486699.1 fumarylacetoacetate hydrolase family protein [Bordetella sp. BOR01]